MRRLGMKHKELFLNTVGEEFNRILQQVQGEYEEKINQLMIENKTIAANLEKANEGIKKLVRKNEELMKELVSLHEKNSQEEVVRTVSKKENVLTTRTYQQVYEDLEKNHMKKENTLDDLSNLLKWNEKSMYYDDDKIIALWIRLIRNKKFTFSEWKERFKGENIHALLFNRSETRIRKLIDTYSHLNDIEALQDLFDYIFDQLIKRDRFHSLKVIALLYIFYHSLVKKYLYQKDVKEYYSTVNNKNIKSLYEDYLMYLSLPSPKTYLKALGALEKYEAQIIQIGGSKPAYLDIVFKEIRDLEKAKQKAIIQKKDSQELQSHNVKDGQLFEMNDKSALMNYGYQISDRTAEQRWRALQKAVPELGLKKVVYIIDNHIKLRVPNKKKFSYSLKQWTMDLEKLKKTYFKGEFIWPKKRY